MFLILFALLPANGKWQRISTNEGVSFLFPNNVQKLKRLTDGIPSTIYQTKDLTCVFGIVCSDFSTKLGELDNKNILQLYEQLRQGSVSMESASLKSERSIPFEGMLVKEIEYTVVKDHYEMTYFKRFIFRDNFVYQISIGGRSRHSDMIKEERDIFFNSITFKDEASEPGKPESNP